MHWSSILSIAGVLVTGAFANEQRPGSDTLRHGTPESVGLLSAPLKEMKTNITSYQIPANYLGFTHNEFLPIEPGSAVIGEFPILRVVQ